MVNITGSFASPSADAAVSVQFSNPSGLLMTIYNGFTWWSALLTLFLAAVVYDQGMCVLPLNGPSRVVRAGLLRRGC